MEKEELKWEKNELEIEEQEENEGGLQVRSSKSAKEMKNEINGHSNGTLKIANGTKKSVLDDELEKANLDDELEKNDLGDELEKSNLDDELEKANLDLADEQEKLEDKYNRVEDEEETEPKEESFEQLLASNNGVEGGTDAKDVSEQQLVTSTDGVDEGTEAEKGSSKLGHSVYFDKDEDSKLTPKPSIKEQIKTNPGDEGVQESAALDIQFNGYLKSDNLSSSSVQPSKDLSEFSSIVHKSSGIDEIESVDTDLINDSGTDVKDFDVENVIQKQNTHDLYCPNCNSCITKRVILHKRKRQIRISGEDVKRNKPEIVVDSKVDASRAQATSNQVRDAANSSLDGIPPLAADDYHPDREPEVFRCLSCFSFFIPAGNGFKLFRPFREKGDKVNIKGEQTPTTNKNWFSSIFAFDKGKASLEQVNNDAGVLEPSDNLKDQSSKSLEIRESVPPAYSSSEITQEAGGNISGSENQDAKMKGKMVVDTVGKSENATKSKQGGSVLDMFGVETSNQPNASAFSKEIQGNNRNDELFRSPGRIQVSNGNLVQDSLPAPQQSGLKFLITSIKEDSLTIEKSETDLKSDVAISNKGPDNESLQSWATTASALNGLDGNGKPKIFSEIPQGHEQHIKAMHLSESPVETNDYKFQLSNKDDAHSYEVSQHNITKTKLEIHSKRPLKVDEDALISSVKDALSIQDTPVNITNISLGAAAANGIAGKDTVITVEAEHEATETSPNLDTQGHLIERQGTDAARVKKIEIIKSIVFGGLAESITSLSVVSSAAGGDTATLNILALGMANLIGGLFIIFHNLWELKKERYEQASNQIMERDGVDRYRQLLGRRESFIVHAVVAVLSYIICGLVPPIVYGFSFRKSDDKELKLVAVAVASLVCILMLAIGKAYVQRAPKPYIKTIATYITLGFMVSGVSWAAGTLFKRLLDKLGIFQSGSTNGLLFSEISGTGAVWASL